MRSEPVAMGTAGQMALEGVSRSYARGQEEVHALRDVSVTLAPGEMVVVLGPSGGGKSTFLHLLGGMDRPDAGRVLADGRDIAALTSDQLTAYRRSQVGFIFQSFHLLAGLTALENVELPLVLAGVSAATRRSRARALLERVGLGDRADHRPGELSGGQAQRVAVARSLAADPLVILADEPSGNLDSQSGQEVMALLAALAREDGRTVVTVTHNEEFVPLADRVIRLRDGRIVSDTRQRDAVAAPARERGARRGGHVAFFQLVRMAVSGATRHAARAVLTGLGVTIGIAAMVLLLGLGAGLEVGVVHGLLDFGPLTSIEVSPQASGSGGGLAGGLVSSGPTTPITAASLKKLSALPGARAAYATVTAVVIASASGRSAEMALASLPPNDVWGVSGLLPTLAVGRWPRAPGEVALPERQARTLMNLPNAPLRKLLGRKVKLSVTALTGSLFSAGASTGGAGRGPAIPTFTATVVGLSSGATEGYVSYGTGTGWVERSTAKGHGVTYPGATVIARASGAVPGLARRVKKMGYGATTLSSILKSVQGVFSVIETGLGAVGGIALVVAGLMIGVVMSMSVLERRREIGVLRAVGARRRDVLWLFLIEAGLIGLAGGVAGVLIGFAGARVADGLVKGQGTAFSHGLVAIPPWLVVLGLGFGAAVAVVAGAIPASHAAALSPVDALRDE